MLWKVDCTQQSSLSFLGFIPKFPGVPNLDLADLSQPPPVAGGGGEPGNPVLFPIVFHETSEFRAEMQNNTLKGIIPVCVRRLIP